MFLQGRATSIGDLYRGLSMLRFPIKKVTEVITNHSFTSITKCIECFSKLAETNLLAFFFRTLDRLEQFRTAYYYPDAFMRVEGFCEDIATIVAGTQPAAKQGLKSVIDRTPPFYNVVVPHVGIAMMVERFKEKVTENWIVVEPDADKDEEEELVLNEERKELPPFASIIAYVMFLMAGKNADIIYRGEYELLASPITSLESMLEPDIKQLLEPRTAP